MTARTIRIEAEDAARTARTVLADIDRTGARDTASMRAVRKRHSRALTTVPGEFVYRVALRISTGGGPQWIGYELVQDHAAAFESLTAKRLEALGVQIDSWWTVDAFARSLTGPAWLRGLISDGTVRKWARSKDLWWRRTALVSTVALNTKSQGGMGDAERTLEICAMLVEDQEDMIVKALSWALRALAPHEPSAVKKFLREHEAALAARVEREVLHKLETGLKNPKRRT